MKNPYFEMVVTAWRFADGRRIQFVLVFFLFFMANIVAMLEPLIFALFLNELQTNPGEYRSALTLLVAYPILELAFWIFHGTGRVIERVTTYHIVKNYRTEVFKVLSSMPLKWHKDNHSGSLMSRIQKSAQALSNFSDDSYMYIETIVRFFAGLTALFVISWLSGVIGLVCGIVTVLIIFRFDKVLVAYLKKINERWHFYDAVYYDYVTNMRTVITLRLEKLAQSETLKNCQKVFAVWNKNAKLNELKWFTLSMVLAVLTFGILFLYVLQHVWSGEMILVGTLVALFQYVERFKQVFYDVAWKYDQLIHYRTDIASMDPIWKAYAALDHSKEASKIPERWERIEVADLHFRYEDEKHRKHNLKGVSVVLERGKKIALIGESGSGKSTMLSLLRGLEQPARVKVTVDWKEIAWGALAGQMTLVPQDPEIFENTIEYNVTAGLAHKAKEVTEAIRLARFDSVVARLPNGLQTNIKEKGVNLSGGEKQRLALARGIFAAKNSSIVLMDEPTSSVDAKNERAIYESLFGHFKDRCIVSTIHRLHLLPEFDWIYSFKNGELVAQGSFKTLLKTDVEFRKNWEVYQKAVKRG